MLFMKIRKSTTIGLFEVELSIVNTNSKVKAVFDTGASRSSVPPFVTSILKLNPNGNYDTIMDASGNTQRLPTYDMIFVVDGNHIKFEPSIRSIPYMLIGMDIISQGKLIIKNDVLEFTV